MNQSARSREQLREQYEVERELAARLRHSSDLERRHLYRDLYDELFRRIPHHDDITAKNAAGGELRSHIWRELQLLDRYVTSDSVFLEIGAGNCGIAREVARTAAQVFALEVSCEIVNGLSLPSNLSVILYDGCTIPIAANSVDVAFSNQVVEHLHPEDVGRQFSQILQSLKEGGRFICLTPHRFSGPHDVSRFFSRTATGFHLHEYTVRELSELLSAVGFSRVRQLVGARGRYVSLPSAPFELLEKTVGLLPYAGRHRLARMHGFRMVLDRLMLLAEK